MPRALADGLADDASASADAPHAGGRDGRPSSRRRRAERAARRAGRRPGRARGRDDARRLATGPSPCASRRAEQLQEGERSPDEPALGEIEVTTFPLTSVLKRHRLLRLPIVRGVVALGDSLVIGFRALEVSANAQLPPEEEQEQEIPRASGPGTVVVALALASSCSS